MAISIEIGTVILSESVRSDLSGRPSFISLDLFRIIKNRSDESSD